ncbi:protein kinase [Nonomuraea sp. NPDC050790]|uniref:protein kinase domain-containing protein n=1 Tax=Nonomuraea sp. NPDC050790 TaxID=3364371 RepID=UPI0037A15A92
MAALTPSDPHRLGGYWLAGRLGAGGQGVVYDAYGPDGERVAIKVPRADSAESRRRLAKEADAARRVAAFCTARVVEVDLGVPYVVSEFVPGRTLREVVGRDGPYRGEALHRLAVGVATALTAIHRAGVVHRDLKPDNIIMGPDGPRVIDFGVAREAGPTTTGPVMGTPNYMAPEVFTGRGAGAAADLWSWGLVVLFAARGADAVEAGEPVAVLTEVLGFRPDVDGLAEPLGPLVAAALAQEPGGRPEARAVLLALLGLPDLTDSDPTDADPTDADAALARGGALAATLGGADDEPGLGAVAEELYGELSERERAAAPEVFLRLTDGENLREVTRAELPDEEAVDGLLTLFTASGLLSAPGADTYSLASPGLVQAWPRLRAWLADNRDGLPVQRRLAEAARFWDGHGRKPADLLQGSHLDRTLRWAAAERKDLTLVRLEREFLDAATARSRRQVRLRAMLAGAMAVLLVLALGGLALAEFRRAEAETERRAATARAWALRAADLRDTDPKLAMLLSVAAWRLAPEVPDTRAALNDALSEPLGDAFTCPGTLPDAASALGGEGNLLVVAQGGDAVVCDLRAGRVTARLTGAGGRDGIALSPDGRLLAARDGGRLRLWDVARGTPTGPDLDAGPLPDGPGKLAFDPSGLLAVPTDDAGLPQGAVPSNGAFTWWDPVTRRPLRPRLDVVSADRRHGLAYSKGRAELWDLARGRRLPAPWLPAGRHIRSAAFTADGRGLLLTHRLPDLGGIGLKAVRVPSGQPLTADGLGPAQGQITLFDDDRFAALWDARVLTVVRLSDRELMTQRYLTVPIADLRFDPGARALRLLGDGGEVFTLDAATLTAPAVLPGDTEGAAAFDARGRRLAVLAGEAVRIWDVAARRPAGGPVPVPPGGNGGQQPVLAFDRDGGRIAAARGKRAVVADAGTGAVLLRLALKEAAWGLVFSPDGRTLAVTGESTVDLWDLASRTVRRVRAEPGGVAGVYRPDGRLLVAGSSLIDPVAGRVLAKPAGAAQSPIAFSPRGDLASGVDAATQLRLWDGALTRTEGAAFIREWRTRVFGVGGGPVAQEEDPVPMTATWSPDGTTIATQESGGLIRLWDVRGRRPAGIVHNSGRPGPESAGAVAFAADGHTLYSAGADGVLRSHPLDAERVARAVCARAGRALTSQEWRLHLAGVEPFAVCA